MKKVDSLFLVLGCLLSLVPIYSKVGWVYLCTIYPDLSLAETGRLYNAKILFNLFDGNYTDSIFIIICGLISCGLLYVSYLNQKNNERSLYTKVKRGLLYIAALFTIWEIFGLM